MADDKKKKRKAAGQPASDNVPAQPENDNIPEPPAAEQEDKPTISPREIWNALPAEDKRRIKEGDITFAGHDIANEELTNEELLGNLLEELEARKQLNEILEEEARTLTEQANDLQELGVTEKSILAWNEKTTKAIDKLADTWQDFITGLNGVVKEHIALAPAAIEALQKLADAIASNDVLQQRIAEYEQLKPYIDAELQKPEYNGRKLSELTKAEVRQVEAAARAAMEKQGTALPSFAATKPTGLLFPLAKIHNDLFNELVTESADKKSIPGQTAFSDIALSVERKGDKPRTVFYSIAFNDLNDAKITKVLTQYDRRVYDAIGSLFNTINPTNDRSIDVVVSLTQIYYAMGNAKDPNSTQLKKILDCLTKIKNADITLDQSGDYAEYVDENKGKLGFKYKGQLLYIETLTATINGKLVDTAIRIFTEPILFRLAKDRGQITTIPRAVLITGKSQTENNIALENYLFDRIARMKNSITRTKTSKGKKSSHTSNRIKYDSIYEALDIKATGTSSERMKKKRAIDNMYELLEHFKANQWIKGYKQSDNAKGEPCVEIYF